MSESSEPEGSGQISALSPGAAPSERPRTTSGEGHGFHIVGIGASAGGLDSLERLFTQLPPDTGMAFVVLQHLSPDFKSLMDELLARRTSMKVIHAEHDMAVEPNTVYLLPPMKEMIIRQRRLFLSDRDPRHGLTLPIDLFFRSLAHEAGTRAVAVVLSGSGSDGSRGIVEISRSGGTVFCESPETAQFNGMPVSALRTGVVDRALSPEELAPALAALSHPADAAADDARERQSGGVDAILRLLRDDFGIDFSHYKTGTVTRRIERRLALNRALDLDAYVAQLRRDPHELSSLYEDLLIGVTRFFRDAGAFEMLEHRVVPDLVQQAGEKGQIRVWVPGCATGEEAYSIAMLLHEELARQGRGPDIKVLATDVHKASLDVAGNGVYAEEQLAGVSDERRRRFFAPRADGFQVTQALRESLVFAPHNLIRDAPFTRIDLVACRNLLIYFQPHAQKTVLTLFHFALKPGGYLFLGSSETPGLLIDEFDTLDEHARIYRKRRDVRLASDMRLPLPRVTTAPKPPIGPRPGVSPQLLSVYDRLLDRFMPPSFLVDDAGQLVDTFGGVEALLKVRSRRPTQSLVDMLAGELKPAVTSVLAHVRHDAESLRVPTPVTIAGGTTVALVADPVHDRHGRLTHVLVSLIEPEHGSPQPLVPPFAAVAAAAPAPAPAGGVGGMSLDEQRAMEDELAHTREHLRTVMQDHDAANEELQATNEELVAANEELQSTNEELHSVNEEMYTVNAEYQRKNLELQEANNDIEHLLNGTEVATLFLDRSLCIRKFTPRIAETFRVIPVDVGRPLYTFTHDLIYPDLMSDIERVLTTGLPFESQVWDRGGRCFFMRVLPYWSRLETSNAEGTPRTPDGVVLTLTDISALEQARATLAQVSAIVESSGDAIVGKTLDGVVTTWNEGAVRLYGYAVEEAVGRHASFLYPPGRKEEIEAVLQEVRAGRPVERLETQRRRKDGSPVDVSVTFSPIYDRSRHLIGISGISRDITQLVRARQEVGEREERIRLLLDSAAEAIYGIDLSGMCIFANSTCAKLLGYDRPEQLIGRQMHQLVHHTRPDGAPQPPEGSAIFRAIRHREGAHVDDEVIWRADGTSFPAEYWSHPILRHGEVIGAVVTFLDVTSRRKAEQEVLEGARRREQFLAMLSHELRNPLAAILTATRVLGAGSWNETECQEAGQVVARQAQHMSRLLDDLLDVARITRGKIALRNEVVDLRDSARAAIEAVQPFMSERQTALDVVMDDAPLWVLGDSTRLQQIHANLLSNAAKYSDPGARVRFRLTQEGEQAVVQVSDEGIGIPREMLPRIFDLFVQGDQSLARSEGGLGIGLTLLRSLVELHSGQVDAASEGPGRGSVFTVRLPLTAEPKAPGASPVTPVRTVVLVEDQPDARRMMQLLLETEGVQVSVAENGLAGTQLIERLQPDLALVDLGLPVLSGFDLARRVRQNPANAGTRLVALSGYGQDSDVKAALASGFDEHLTKPPDPGQIDRLLRGDAPRATEEH